MLNFERTWQKILKLSLAATLLYTLMLLVTFIGVRADGCSLVAAADGFIVERANAGCPLHSGDVIVAASGYAFDENLLRVGFWHQQLIGLDGCEDAVCQYTILRDAEEMSVAVKLERVSLAGFVSRVGILLLTGLTFVLLALYLTLRRSDDWAGCLLALALLLQGLNLINNSLGAFSANLAIAFAWLSIPLDLLTFWFALSMALHLFLVFPDKVAWFHRWPWLVFVLHGFNPLVSLLGVLIIRGGLDIQNIVAFQSSVYVSSYPIAIVQLVGVIGLLIYTYRTTHRPLVRNQIRWIVWGLTVSACGWVALYAIPVTLVGGPLVSFSTAMLPMIALPISLTLAITRYRLLEIDTLINRSLVYGLLSLFLMLVYFIDIVLLSRAVQLLTGRAQDTAVVMVSTLAVALIFAPARNYAQKFIDRIFYQDKLDFQQLLQDAVQKLSTTIVLDDLVALTTQEIPQRLKLKGAALYILGPEEKRFIPYGWPWAQRLSRHQVTANNLDQQWLAGINGDKNARREVLLAQLLPGIQLCLPLSSSQGLIGLYGFAAKRSGNLYTGQEIDILTVLSHQLVISLENARLYRQVETYSKGLEELASQRTRQLEHANQELSAEKNKLDAVLNTIADGLIVTDVTGCIVMANPVTERMLGQPAAHLIGRPLSAWVNNNVLVNTTIAALEQPGVVLTIDFDLGDRIIKGSSCALSEAGRDLTGVVTILRDVTHEVAVDRMKTEFISTVSHELRTPLTSVLGFSKLIRRAFERNIVPALADKAQTQQSVERVIDNLDIIEAESQRLTRLINDVLDIAKMEAGKIEWQQALINVEDMIRSAVAAVSALALDAKHDLPLLVDVVPNLPLLHGDPDRLLQVLTNLLSNAIKFTDLGQITIRARQVRNLELPAGHFAPLFPDDWKGDWLMVSVTDTGIGIASKDLLTVFSKFKQVGDTLTDRPKGTGLGLSICKEIIEHHRGVIWVESELTKGSTFYLALPVRPVKSVSAEPPAHKPTSLTEIRQRVSEVLPPPSSSGPSPLILIVDDEQNIRQLLYQELDQVGYQVIQAVDGIEALAKARAYKPDLIVLDVMMPDVSGFDVTSVLKADQETADIPILILSIIEDRKRGLDLGADEYLTKPIDTDRLLRAIASLIHGSPAERQSKILVADEDVSVVETVTQALRERGFHVVEAFGSRDALQKAQAERPDLIILDAMMSTMNDYELLKALRYQDHAQQANIIVMAADRVDDLQADVHQQAREGEGQDE